MKKTAALLFTFFILVSCSGDDQASEQFTGVLVKKIIATDGSSTHTTEYTYDGNKFNTITHDGGYTIKHTYSGDLIVSVRQFQSPSFMSLETTFQYDSGNRVIKATSYDVMNGYTDVLNYTYNNDNTISYTAYDGSATPTGITGKIYLNAAGETIKTENFYQGTLTYTYLATYDTNNSPLKNIAGYSKIPYNPGKYNNAITNVHSNGSGVVTSNSDFTNSYNSGNYLSQAVQRFYNSGVLQSTTTIQYLY